MSMYLFLCGMTNIQFWTDILIVNSSDLHLPQSSCFLLTSAAAFDCFECPSKCICLVFLCPAVLHLMSAVTVSLYERTGVYLALSGKVVIKQEWWWTRRLGVFELKWGRILSEGLLPLTLEMCWGSCCLDGKTRAILPACCTLCADKDFLWQKIPIFSCLREVFAGGEACVCWKKQARKREAEHESLFSRANPPVAHQTVLMRELFS